MSKAIGRLAVDSNAVIAYRDIDRLVVTTLFMLFGRMTDFADAGFPCVTLRPSMRDSERKGISKRQEHAR